MTARAFSCAWCNNKYEVSTSDAELLANFEARFGRPPGDEEISLVCGECDSFILDAIRDHPDLLARIEAKCGIFNIDAKPSTVM